MMAIKHMTIFKPIAALAHILQGKVPKSGTPESTPFTALQETAGKDSMKNLQ
jgi:hypothetical protein